ncbi:ras guanine nucleotide exchange factor domain-containing protein [Amylocarpus encephaloides]|uniref:Ras guanine nucleotide exchange factor domain-containing protein n=1 Tax=Amylocarpus encephaloides TaxID=45428 RepID=A0A9P7YA85_9HELO|nr:ras guanine nucleotide exchange factor domain-containing protein [Amylocarpus encephaloides]
MDGVGLLLRNKSTRAWPSNSSRGSHRGDRSPKTSKTSKTPKISKTSNATPRSARPPISPRTASAPLVPMSRETAFSKSNDLYRHRDSVASVHDDPFFKHYQSPQSVSLSKEMRSASYMDRQEELGSDGVHSRAGKNAAVDNSVNLPPQSRSGMSDINIAIIGSAGVGKSTLIQRALSLRAVPTSSASSLRMSVDNVVYTVSLIELDLESFDIAPDRRIEWPKQINGNIVPRMDGALLLYDVMNRESIAALPHTLNGLVNSALPTILVSCKCDNPENTRQINVDSMESACHSCIEAVKTAANVPETARSCLSSMLRAIMANRNAPNPAPDVSGTRRRATSSAHLETPADPTVRPLSQQSKHSRASSDYSLLRGFPSPPPVSSRQPPLSRQNVRTNLQQQVNLPDPHEAPPLSSHPAFRHDSFQNTDPNSKFLSGSKSRSALPSPARGGDSSFLDMEEAEGDSSYRYSDDTPILQRGDDSFFDKPAKVAGVSFDELVDRLLGQNMSRADSNFSDIFLCLYRKFAAPGELFAAILGRLEAIADDKSTHYLTRTATQLRIIAVVARWVSSYPGDFASPSTSRNLDGFINHLSNEPVFAAAAQDMRMQLQSRVVEDDDTGWARTDADVESENSSLMESAPTSPIRRRTNPLGDLEESVEDLQIGEAEDDEMDKLRTTESTNSGRPESGDNSMSGSFHTVDDYEKEAATMVPKSNLPLTKFRYHIFMDTSEDDIADEMTRIDWVMFSSIRLRDLVRHVSLSLEQKEKCKSLTNVNRMIRHFNHIAHWVANMILMRDKAKHRAQMLEKFMTIALKLRLLNNYNGLAAVLAGINGSAIHRLTQTRNIVPAEVQKRFARLVVLMGSQKSHFAYRLAWENSPLPRIPFIPLHRRDLVSAEEGSRTFVGANGERINWKKFEVLSEVILPIMKSQVVSYPNLSTHDGAREMILDCRMPVDDEDIYQRSLALENSSGPVETVKKKFPWFQSK